MTDTDDKDPVTGAPLHPKLGDEFFDERGSMVIRWRWTRAKDGTEGWTPVPRVQDGDTN